MKWQWVLIFIVVYLCMMSPSLALRSNFQDYNMADYQAYGNPSNPYVYPLISPTTNQVLGYTVAGGSDGTTIINTAPVVYTYAAWDIFPPTTVGVDVWGYDSAGGTVFSLTAPNIPEGRLELKIIGGTPTLFSNGIQKATAPVITVNPSYIRIYPTITAAYIDNILIGETDHHVVGALPSNYTIIRDLINPSATGMYGWNNGTSTWDAKNSQYFYIDADTDSQDAVYLENFDIVNLNSGVIVNTTVIDSTIPRHQIQYNITSFLNTAYEGSSQIPDGEYYAQFRGYPDSRAYFWVISQGASVSWSKSTYAQNEAATITYTISPAYYDTSTYGYTMEVLDVYRTVKKTTTLSAISGTVTISSLDSTTYPPGVYYAEVIATKKSDSSTYVMNYAATEVTDYVYISGYVMNSETGAILSGANVTVSQGSSSASVTSSSSGYTSSNNWLANIATTVLTNLTGYSDDVRSFTPLSAGDIPLNISLSPTSHTYTGVAIGGVVRDDQYGNPVSSALVTVRNTTYGESNTVLTNIAGGYTVNSLTNGHIYDDWSYKVGYNNSTTYHVLAVGT